MNFLIFDTVSVNKVPHYLNQLSSTSIRNIKFFNNFKTFLINRTNRDFDVIFNFQIVEHEEH